MNAHLPDVPPFCAWPAEAGPLDALVDADGTEPGLTWDGVGERIAGIGSGLLAQGLRPGELVAAGLGPGLATPLMQLALPRLGAALLPLGGSQDPGALMGLAGAEWACSGDGPDLCGRWSRRAPALGHDTPHRAMRWSSPLALVVATSGTSGAPRAAMLTAANLVHSARSVNGALGFSLGDRWLCCLPLSHIGGLAILYRCALAGGTLVRRARFVAAEVLDDLARWRITHCSLVPAMLAALVELGPAPASLRVALVGGQGLSPALAQRAIAAGWPIQVSYGMTETASAVAISARLGRAPADGWVGPALPGIEIACPDCSSGPGPLALRGHQVMAGYANPARCPGEGLVDGWLTTADLACRAPDGMLRVAGRADAVLVTGGVKVHPERIEGLLSGAPGVGEVTVVGVEDPVWGMRLVACYTGDADPAGLDAWCRVHVPSAERPRRFMHLAVLPRLASGKPDRRGLQVLAASP